MANSLKVISVRSCRRQREAELAAFAGTALDRDIASVLSHDLAGGHEA